MYPFKAIGLSCLIFVLVPFWACGQQNGSKSTTKTKSELPVKNKATIPARQKPADTKAASAKQNSSKKALKPAPPQLQKLFNDVLKENQQKSESNLGFEIDGLLIDETLTKTGHDFYDLFYSNWEAPEQVNNFSVKIIERPLRGRGFQIIVSVNDVEIIEENLQPRYDMLEDAALNAVETARSYLLNYENLKNQLDTDDQQGTGLF